MAMSDICDSIDPFMVYKAWLNRFGKLSKGKFMIEPTERIRFWDLSWRPNHHPLWDTYTRWIKSRSGDYEPYPWEAFLFGLEAAVLSPSAVGLVHIMRSTDYAVKNMERQSDG